jgi:hypothetical protein
MVLSGVGLPFLNAIRHVAAVAGFALASLGMVVPTAAARTALVCPGPQPDPAPCFTVDTSVLGGRAFDDYRVTRPGKLLFHSEARRAELATLPPDTAAQYCAVNPAATTKGSLPTVAEPAVRAEIERELGQLLADVNRQIPNYEQLKMMVIAREPFSIENGMLAPTMKLRRAKVEAAVASQLEKWYAQEGPVVWA